MAADLDIDAACQVVVQALQGVQLRAAQDPAEVNTPGAWVTWEGVQSANLRGSLRHLLAVYLVVGDQDWRRASEGLSSLYNQAVPAAITPDGPVVPQAVVLPGSTTPLPALRVPVHITTE